MLDGTDTQLRSHIGQEVEVTGHLSSGSSSTSSSSSSSSSPQRFEVQSVRMLSASCNQ
jgi:hypothetical protein